MYIKLNGDIIPVKIISNFTKAPIKKYAIFAENCKLLLGLHAKVSS